MAITTDMLVDDVMQRWPSTIRVFLDFRMRCVGCPIACFHTVADAAREHGVDCGALVASLLEHEIERVSPLAAQTAT